ncbi:MAG TPA: hypothetical protein VG387_19225, partial [Rhizomicrobium sp.]|nr:hypothetical protein [Rhizomicrobium sp.]
MSNPSSFSITLYNHTGVTWGKYATTPTNGAAAQANGQAAPAVNTWQNVSVADGGSIAVAASNGSGNCQGQFMFEDSAKTTKFVVQYTVPNDSGDASVTFAADKDYPASIGMTDAWPDDLSGPSLSLSMAVYAGVAVTEWNSSNQARTAGYTVPAAGNPYKDDNARDVVNSMFQADIRSPNAVKHWYDQNTRNPYHPADYSGQIGGGGGALVAKMVSLWPSIGNATTGPDYPLISFLADFLVPTDTSQAPLVMYVPTLTYNGYSNGDDKGPIYGLTGYTAYPLAGNGTRFDSNAVQIFLTLFLAGAHFVNIQTDQDFQNVTDNANQANTGRDLYQAFKDAFADDGSQTGRHRCIGNSHYVFHSPEVNTQSWYYGGQMGEWASSGCGLLLSCLVGPTANGPYNTF